MKPTACAQVQSLLSEYSDHCLSQRQAGRVAAHLEQCAACQEELESLKRIRATLRHAEMPLPQADFWPSLSAKLRDSRQAQMPAKTARALHLRRGIWAPLCALCAAAPVLLWVTYWTPGPEMPSPTPVQLTAQDDTEFLIARHAEFSAESPLGNWEVAPSLESSVDVNATESGSPAPSDFDIQPAQFSTP